MEKLLPLVGLAMLALAFFGGGQADETGPVELASAATELPEDVEDGSPRAGNTAGGYTISRAPDGHFYADVVINGSTSHMLIDTGASSIILSRSDAQRVGITARPGEFTATARTAGGDIALKPVTLNRVAVGPIEGRDINAMVAETDLPVSLLGQSFLERVGTVEISGDEMHLR